MTTTQGVYSQIAALRRAAVRATLAPSVHNSQPWRFDLTPGVLEIWADPSRQLTVLDPTRRQLTISCGCALLNARVALSAAGLGAVVERFPDAERPDLVARVRAIELREGSIDAISCLDPVLELRHTNRRRFSDDAVPAEFMQHLIVVAAEEGATLFPIRSEDHRLAIARLSQHADGIQNLNQAYRAEMRAWTTDDPQRRDGVPAMAVPHVDGTAQDDIPIRDFDSQGAGWLPSQTYSSRHQCLFLLATDSETPLDWLRAGEALERVLLEVTRHGFAASPFTQVIEVPSARAALRAEFGLAMYPHILLRVGQAPLTPQTRRRRLVEVLNENL